jgi:hypothetical protein
MKRTWIGWLAGVLLAALTTAAAAEPKDVDIGGLSATYLAPAGKDKVPGVVMIAGSGPTDRNGNNAMGLKTDTYKLLAEALATAGIASVRYDKRGIAGSVKIAKPERELTIGHFADDAVAVTAWLRKKPEIGSIVLIGHSEGGLIALLTAKRAHAAGVVLLATPGRRLAAVLREQFTRAGSSTRAYAPEALAIIAALERGEDVAEVEPALAGAFRPSVQPYLRSMMAVDPAALADTLGKPLMVVGGGRDIQVGKSDFDALTASRPDAVAYWEPSMAHTLKLAGANAQSMASAYTDPNLPLPVGLADRIIQFVKELK